MCGFCLNTGDKRKTQFFNVVLPMIKGDLVSLTNEDLEKIAVTLLKKDGVIENRWPWDEQTNEYVSLATSMARMADGISRLREEVKVVVEKLDDVIGS